jgi:hypothetical protein
MESLMAIQPWASVPHGQAQPTRLKLFDIFQWKFVV